MVRSLAALTTLLGKPGCHTLVGVLRGPARVAAHWPCGCVASGVSFSSLELETCRAHRPRTALVAERTPAA